MERLIGIGAAAVSAGLTAAVAASDQPAWIVSAVGIAAFAGALAGSLLVQRPSDAQALEILSHDPDRPLADRRIDLSGKDLH